MNAKNLIENYLNEDKLSNKQEWGRNFIKLWNEFNNNHLDSFWEIFGATPMRPTHCKTWWDANIDRIKNFVQVVEESVGLDGQSGIRDVSWAALARVCQTRGLYDFEDVMEGKWVKKSWDLAVVTETGMDAGKLEKKFMKEVASTEGS